MNTQLFLLALFVALLILPSFIQKAKDKVYKGKGYRISYPYNWEIAVQNDIVHLYPTENDGAITISTYTGIDMPDEEIPAFLFNIHHIDTADAPVMIVPKGDMTEFFFEHTKAQVQWVTKAIRHNNELYLLTVNCVVNKWSSSKPVFLKAIHSFRPG
jgi:hypothetical protein